MYKILQGDCLETLKTLPDCSVQCCVTSPPYYGLRDYGVDGQIGLEETPEIYVNKLVEVFREVRRVLKDDGTVWLNLGDSYAGSNNGSNDHREQGASISRNDNKYQGQKPGFDFGRQGKTSTVSKLERGRGSISGNGLKPKDLIGIPWMVAFALRADGWWLRSDIIWAKPNPMPESVTDRCTKSHEYIFLLTKSARYYYDYIAIQEPAAYDGRKDEQFKGSEKYKDSGQTFAEQGHPRWNKNADGLRVRNKRDVWTVVTKSYREAHFATYNPDLIEPCILAGSSERGECPKCGKAWVRVVEKGESLWEQRKAEGAPMRKGTSVEGIEETHKLSGARQAKWKEEHPDKFIGWQPQCECGLEPVPQTVLDPFSGSGTTLAVSIKHGRSGIGCELNPDYIELTHKRLAEVQPTLKGM